MDYTKYFKKGGWAAAGRYYAMHPGKLKELFTSAKKYATKDGLKAVKDEFLFICQYIRDVFTGKYTEYSRHHARLYAGHRIDRRCSHSFVGYP